MGGSRSERDGQADIISRLQETLDSAIPKGWIDVGKMFNVDDWSSAERDELIKESLRRYRQSDPMARGIINLYRGFILGGPLLVQFDDPANREIWRRFERENGFQQKLQAMVAQKYLVGEHFLRFFGRPASKANGRPPKVRAVPQGWVTHIETSPEDYEDERNFHIVIPLKDELGNSTDKTRNIKVSRGDIVHPVYNPLGTSPRGWPLLAVVFKYISRYENFLNTRLILNAIRASICLHVSVGNASMEEIKKLEARLKKIPQPGSVVFTPESVELKFPKFEVNASDTKDDGEPWLNLIAQAMMLETRILKMSLDSSRVKQSIDLNSPMLKHFDLERTALLESCDEIVRRVMGEGVAFRCILPPMVKGNLQSDAQGATMMIGGMASSRKTQAEHFGMDWHDEQKRIEEEKAWFESMGLQYGTPLFEVPQSEPNAKPDEGNDDEGDSLTPDD